jgi:predicted dehydrogenase
MEYSFSMAIPLLTDKHEELREQKVEKLRIGIIGTGGISNAHIDAYQAIPDMVEVVAGCDLDGDKVRACAEKNGFSGIYTDYYEMLAKEHLDCVSVCTWNAAHKDAAIAALKSGANVLCEKPMAINAREAMEMESSAEEAGKLLQIGFVRRFGSDAEAVRRLADTGVLGDIYYAKAHYLRRDGGPRGWFTDKAYSGGGPLIDLGVHLIDLVRYLAGNPKPVCAFGVTYDNLGPNRALDGQLEWDSSTDNGGFVQDTEDIAAAIIKFDNGMTLQTEVSFNLNISQPRRGLELYGTKAGVKIDDAEVEYLTAQAGMYVQSKPVMHAAFNFSAAFRAEVKSFIQASLGRETCRATAHDGVEMMMILDAVYESARTGSLVPIMK